jgi:hypothetical protein
MGFKKDLFRLMILIFGMPFFNCCHTGTYENTQKLDRQPKIEPDYSDVTIPPNIAPLNFVIKEIGSSYRITATSASQKSKITITSADGIVQFPEKSWNKLIKDCQGDKIKIQVFAVSPDKKSVNEFEPLYMQVANEPIDPYLVYRLIHPGYYSWSKIKIVQRCLENFQEEPLVENQLIENNCVNCHSFSQNNPDRFLVHIRGSKGGTYFVEDGKISKIDLKIKNMPGGATYPSWHPGGRFVAFSSNQVRQSFYAQTEKSIEVFDLVSTLILYDRNKNTIVNITGQDTINHLQTFPSWSPDGKYLYFCSADHCVTNANPDVNNIQNIHYNIVRKSFNPETAKFGETELVFDATAIKKSASFPRISPDGKYLVFTLADYGTFPIWHQEADLYMLNLQNGESKRMSLNSDKTESYHSWSTNGKWLVFSSKRIDGRSARPFFAYIGSYDHIGKPFVLPQEDPTLYNRMLESFNIPELVNGRITVNPRDFAAAANQELIKAQPGAPSDTLQRWIKNKADKGRPANEKGIHE